MIMLFYILGYLALGCIAAGINASIDHEHDETIHVMIALLWPLAVFFLVVYGLFKLGTVIGEIFS